jgi:hypothetical protein
LTLVILAFGSAASETLGRTRQAPAPTASVFMKDLRCMAKFLSTGISAAGEFDDIIPKHRVNRAM